MSLFLVNLRFDLVLNRNIFSMAVTLLLLIAAIVIVLCVILNNVSNKLGIPMLLAFILLGMLFGTDTISL